MIDDESDDDDLEMDDLELMLPSTSQSKMLYEEFQDADSQLIGEPIPSTSGNYLASIHLAFAEEAEEEEEEEEEEEPEEPEDEDEEDEELTLEEQIENMKRLIECFKRNVDGWLALLKEEKKLTKEAKEAYLQEYQEGANSLHRFQCKKIKLELKRDKIQEMEESKKKVEEPEKEPSIIYVCLPENQHTIIRAQRGVTLRDALTIPMQRRNLILENCAAFIKREDGSMFMNTCVISWDTDTSSLEDKEVFVKTLETVPIPVFLPHEFVYNTFLLGQCSACRNAILYGIICRACNRKYHTRCMNFASLLCEHVKRRRPYYERILTCNAETGLVQIPPRPAPTPSTYPAYLKKQRIKEAIARLMEPPTREKSVQVKKKYLRRERLQVYKTKFERREMDRVHPLKDDAESSDSLFSEDSAYDRLLIDKDIMYEKDITTEKGAFGTVYKAQCHGPVAVKRFNTENPNELQIHMFKNEVNVIRKLCHPHVLKYRGWVSKPYLGLVTLWCDGQTLYDRVHNEDVDLHLITIMIILKQTSEGMSYLHSRNIHHRDLKSKNIFLHEGIQVQIGDFGLAVVKKKEEEKDDDYDYRRFCVYEGFDPKIRTLKVATEDLKPKKFTMSKEQIEEEVENKFVGTVGWIAPEVMRMKELYPYSFQSDVYSFGIVIYELLARDLPFGRNADKLFIVYNVGRSGATPDETKIRADVPKRLKKLYNQCIEFEREKRPLFSYITEEVYSIFKVTPKTTRTTSFPLQIRELPDTYIEKDPRCQDFIDSDHDADFDAKFRRENPVLKIPTPTEEEKVRRLKMAVRRNQVLASNVRFLQIFQREAEESIRGRRRKGLLNFGFFKSKK
ncbi:PREDICTED: serine/threonine-protein kinase B-raf [Wasmannia auropunctata]|uniref:serine/threonine-protein kinase B-raf n=1 Tax=Wasmannia auropunctata TaxID=64793 RepID=UPI0005F0003A|nr:PREDICTED: serine/threonine-protein kinase B-raf [Wasmannia auropunctata]XP_011695441.1 PREDICTED: serine/threonine-protein kinase B-raf [Wasmannia auropunctata]